MTSRAGHWSQCIRDYRPTRGGYCPGCQRDLPYFATISAAHEAHALQLLAAGRPIDAVKYLHEHCDLAIGDGKRTVAHMYPLAFRPLGPPCALCDKLLRTPRAKLCVECGARRTDD